MAKHIASITSNKDVYLVTAHKPAGNRDYYMATVSIFGTFGGGSVALKMSPDKGTTKIAMKDLSGVSYAVTSDDTIDIILGAGTSSLGDEIKIYATMSGATTPSVTVIVHDNLG